MTHLAELLQWDRFITPSIIRVFYWLCLTMTVLAGLSLVLTALGMMAINLIAGLLLLVASMIFILTGIIFVRILCELVMVIFRINEHLGVIRDRGEEIDHPSPPRHARQRRA